MRRATLFLTAAALVVGTASLDAQTSNLAGSWTRIADSSGAATNGGAPDGLTIVQDSKVVRVTWQTMNGDEAAFVYDLDGTDSKKTMTDGNGNQFEIATRAKWDGPRLVTTMTRDASAPATFVYSLDASGHLVLTVMLPPRGGGDPVIHTVSYKKN